jgi:hypothetical protein
MDTDGNSDDNFSKINSEQLEFQKEVLALKEDFYKDSMATPAALEQELLVAEILREDLYDIADYLDDYIDTGDLHFPSTNVINVYNQHEKKITDEIVKYSKQKQILINQFMNDLREILIAYLNIDGFLKKYYINQIFRVYVFNLNNILPGENNDEGI